MTLRTTLASIVSAAVLGIGVLASAAPLPPVSDSALRTYRSLQMRQFEDPDANLGYLKKNEYVLPNDVFDAYLRLEGSKAKAVGMFINEAGFNQGEEFQKQLSNLGYDDGVIHTYFTILNRRRSIIIKEAQLRKPHFRTILLHERVHKAMPDLPHEDITALHKGYEGVKETLPKKYFEKHAKAGSDPWIEFYPYLSDDKEFDPAVEEKLKKDHPKAHEVYTRMVEPIRKELLL